MGTCGSSKFARAVVIAWSAKSESAAWSVTQLLRWDDAWDVRDAVHGGKYRGDVGMKRRASRLPRGRKRLRMNEWTSCSMVLKRRHIPRFKGETGGTRLFWLK